MRVRCVGLNLRRILLGDFNATEDEPAIRLISEQFQDAFRVRNPLDRGFTWDNRNPLTREFAFPDRRVDYIFCPRDAVVNDCKIILNQATPAFPSDHYGVMADIEW